MGPVAVVLGVLGVLGWATPSLVSAARSPGRSAADLVAAGAALAAWLLMAWLALGCLAVGLARVPGSVGRLADALAARLLPRAGRQLIAAALGLTCVTGPLAASAHPLAATTVAVAPAVPAPVATLVDRPAPAPSPSVDLRHAALVAIDRPSAEPYVTTPPTRRPVPAAPVVGPVRAEAAVPDAVVVRPGDSLWTIAARHLGAAASPDAVAREWPRWWHANRGVIGDDPSLLLPGQRLQPPEA